MMRVGGDSRLIAQLARIGLTDIDIGATYRKVAKSC
jgi:hypothetical protein